MFKNLAKRVIGGLNCTSREFVNNGPLIVIYHRFSDIMPEYDIRGAHSNGTPKTLEKEIIFLKRNFKIVSFEEFLSNITNKDRLRKMALITFDDGYKDNYDCVYPILKKHKVPAVLFVTCNVINNEDMFWFDKLGFIFKGLPSGEYSPPLVDKIYLPKKGRRKFFILFAEKLKDLRPEETYEIIAYFASVARITMDRSLFKKLNLYLSEEEIKEMHSGGLGIGAHGLSHNILNKISADEARKEISQSKSILTSLLNDNVDYFSYPDGKIGKADRYLVEIVKECGYKAAVTTNMGKNKDFNEYGVFGLKRVSGGQNFYDFRYYISKSYKADNG